jgi:hypothetical protein
MILIFISAIVGLIFAVNFLAKRINKSDQNSY